MRFRAAIVGAAWSFVAAPAGAAAPPPRDPVEACAASLVGAPDSRAVVRTSEGADVWWFGGLAFDQSIALARRAISNKRVFDGQLRLDRWTPIDADRSVRLEIVGAARPYRLRLSRHLGGTLVVIEGGADPASAPAWLPPFRPRPILILHGPIAR